MSAEVPSSLASSSAEKEEDWFELIDEPVMAAIDAGGSEVEGWGSECNESLLWESSPEMSPQLPFDIDESDTFLSEMQNLQLFLQAAEQPQNEGQPSAGPSVLDDHTYAAQAPSHLAQTPLKPHLLKEQQKKQLDEVGLFVAC